MPTDRNMPATTGCDAPQCVRPANREVDALLLNPPWVSKDQNIWHGIKAAMPPLGLLSVAAFAEREGFQVEVLDLHVERWSIDRFRQYLQTVVPKHVGISMMTATAIAANRVARIVKEIHPECTVVVGGVHAEAMPGECLKNHAIDIVVRGDGEFTFADILRGKPKASIRGISYRRGRLAVHNASAAVIDDLDVLAMPAYHMVPMHKYYPAIGAYRRLPAINMLMTRGCPGKCTFCNSAETKLRARSADLVVDEIAHLRHRYGIREVQFYDDTFTVLKQNCLRFCRLMKERDLGVSWTAFVRTDCFNEELARALKEGGCHQVMFGVESGDEQILLNIRKPIDKKRTGWAIKIAQQVGLEVRATFMLGNPGETVASMRRTIDYALKLDPDLALFNITTPYPGTQMFEWAKRNGVLNTEDWGDYELSSTIMSLPTVSPEDIQAAYASAHKEFYGRPIAYWRRLKRIRTLSHVIDNVRGFVYIILRRNIGRRGVDRREWINGRKEDFWSVPLEDPTWGDRMVRTSEIHNVALGEPVADVTSRHTVVPLTVPAPA
jgi:radical SAM superfamily enzyme YgiQ (UPF0313 family)